MDYKKGHSPIMRGILAHLELMNTITRHGKDRSHRTTNYTPSPFGLFVALCLAADYKTGLVDASVADIAAEFRIHQRIARRILAELISKNYLLRLFSKKPLLFVKKYPIWEGKELYRLAIAKNVNGSYRIFSRSPKGTYKSLLITVYGTYTSYCVQKMGYICTVLHPQSLKTKQLK